MSPNRGETEDEYIDVRFRDPTGSTTSGRPTRPRTRPTPVRGERGSDGTERGDDWAVESVLISENVGEEKAEEQATEIVEKIES